MRPRDPLHLGALLCAIAAFFWALTTFIGFAFPLAFLCGLAAGIVLVLSRHLDASKKQVLRGTAVALIVTHAVFIFLFVLTTPVNIGEDPGRGFNLDPPQWAQTAIDAYAVLLFLLAAILLPAGIVFLAGNLERAIAGIGASVVIIVVILGLLGVSADGEAGGIIFRILFLLGFAAIGTACLMPPMQERRAPWDASR